MKPAKKYFGKILLFGEYTVLRGGSALTIPYYKVSGYLDFLKLTPTYEQHKSNTELKKFSHYIQEEEVIDISRFAKDIERGLFFSSTIPTGYGLGSSGALVASVYEHYGNSIHRNNNDLSKLKKDLGKMETYFHGKSSGIDPLSCYLQKPLLLQSNEIKIIDSDKLQIHNLFLLDTGKKGSTNHFVPLFNDKCSDKEFADVIDSELNQANLSSVDAYIHNDFSKLATNFKRISMIEYNYFNEMIPKDVQLTWLKGIETGEYYLKLCGSGGGGYFTGISLVSKEKLTLSFPHSWLDYQSHPTKI